MQFTSHDRISIRNPKHIKSNREISGLTFTYHPEKKSGYGEFELADIIYSHNLDMPFNFCNIPEQIIWIQTRDGRTLQLGVNNIQKTGRLEYTFQMWNCEYINENSSPTNQR